MSDNGQLEIKSVEQAQQDTIQSRATQEAQGRLPLLAMLSHAGEIISPWWSKRRDWDLDRFWKQSDHVSGAFYVIASKLSSIPRHVLPRDPSVALHRKLASEYQYRLDAESEFGLGLDTTLTKFLLDLWSTDNGGFLEIIGGGPKDGEIKGLPVGIAHLDSLRCTRTGSVEYPVIYEDTDGRTYKLHRTRVLFRSQLPSARADLYGVGFCWLSRCINTAQSLVDVLVYKQEKLGSRPKRAIGITKGGLDPESIVQALNMADAVQDSMGLRRFSKIPFVGDETIPDADISIIDMASLPDGFDYEKDLTLGMFTIALTGSVPPRWLWPATTTGATKADAMYQHVAGLTGGPGATLKMIAEMLGGPDLGEIMVSDVPHFLPPQLKLVFDFQDDEQDRISAEIANTRSQQRERDINDGAITIRVAREQMLDKGEISESNFNEMELDDGRLPDGMDVLTLFHSKDSQYINLLAIGAAGNPLEIENNVAEEWIPAINEQVRTAEEMAVNGPNANIRRKARQAIVALQKLRDLYQSPGENTDTEPMNTQSENVVPEVPQDNPFDVTKSLSSMRASIRSAIRGYWTGEYTRFQFVDEMNTIISRRLTEAYELGARECGILPDELTQTERAAQQDLINGQLGYVIGLADDIEENKRDAGGRLGPLIARASRWAAQYDTAFSNGKANACGNRKAKFVLGPTEKHCRTCGGLANKVYRYSTWVENGAVPPKNARFECGSASYCECRLEDTEDRITPGPFPKGLLL